MGTINHEYRKQLASYNVQLKAGTKRKDTICKGTDLHAIFGQRRNKGFTMAVQRGKYTHAVRISESGVVNLISVHLKADNAILSAYLNSGRTVHEFVAKIGF